MKQPSAKALIFRIVTILYLVAVAYLCFANMNNLPDVPKTFLGMELDKIAHFCMFFPFPILGYLSWDRKSPSLAHSIALVITIAALGCIFAGLTELIQGMMPYRTEDIRDYKADIIAMVISSVVVFIYDRKRK